MIPLQQRPDESAEDWASFLVWVALKHDLSADELELAKAYAWTERANEYELAIETPPDPREQFSRILTNAMRIVDRSMARGAATDEHVSFKDRVAFVQTFAPKVQGGTTTQDLSVLTDEELDVLTKLEERTRPALIEGPIKR